MSERNLSIFVNPADKTFSLRKGVIPSPDDDQVLIAVTAAGVCATDVHLWTWGEIGSYQVKTPHVLGHEGSGQVVKVGDNVKHLKPGDRVAIETAIPCYHCDICLSGRYNICPHLKSYGLPPYHGLYTKYFAHDANFCYKIPDHMTDEEGSMVEPLSVAVHACRRGNISVGDHVLVYGAGPIGLLVMLVAKAMGASKVLIIDIRQDRLNFASKLKADHTLLVGKDDSEVEIANNIRRVLGRSPVVTLDCCGFEKSLKTSILATESGGVVVVVGLGPGEVSLPIVDAALREVDIKGIVRYPNCYQRSINMISAGQIDVKPLITHRFKFSEAAKAFEMAKDGSDGAIKIIIKCQE